MARIANIKELSAHREKLLRGRPADEKFVAICTGTGCKAYGADKVVAAFTEELKKTGLDKDIRIRATGCHGFCERGTLVVVQPEGVLYQRVKPENVPDVVEKTLKNGEISEDLLYDEPTTGQRYKHEQDIPFYKHQNRLILGKNGHIDPSSIDDYISQGGYGGLAKALEMGGDKVLDEVKKANLRGRGGGGFPAGRKWETCRNAEADKRYVVCNADEGDPGAFMDRTVLESDPHAVLEGMAIGAFATGADEAYIYCRAEYPLAIRRLKKAIAQAEDRGYLGDKVLGKGFSFHVHIKEGAGAFVCGEETALLASIEGKRGMPRPRPPFPAQSGLFGKPTTINNVETWANVPWIIRNGAAAFAGRGTEKSKGSKVFALAGKIKRGGLVEVPMGISLKEIITEIGGGTGTKRKVKAVQLGGPSGGCVPAGLFDTKIDYDEVNRTGAIMGSGGMVVMDDTTCMVDVARYFLNFTYLESCGKCTFCRVGTKRMLEILERVTEGEGKMEDLDKLEDLAHQVKDTSLCGLGQTAPNPVLTTLRYFREEYEEHIVNKKCRAGKCRNLSKYEITDACTGCMVCGRQCPVDAISGEKKQLHVIDQEDCIKCGVCRDVCKFDAVVVL